MVADDDDDEVNDAIVGIVAVTMPSDCVDETIDDEIVDGVRATIRFVIVVPYWLFLFSDTTIRTLESINIIAIT